MFIRRRPRTQTDPAPVLHSRIHCSMLGLAVNRQPGFRRGTRRAKQRREEQPRWLTAWLASWLADWLSAGSGCLDWLRRLAG